VRWKNTGAAKHSESTRSRGGEEDAEQTGPSVLAGAVVAEARERQQHVGPSLKFR